jgi:hypothetical protein
VPEIFFPLTAGRKELKAASFTAICEPFM